MGDKPCKNSRACHTSEVSTITMRPKQVVSPEVETNYCTCILDPLRLQELGIVLGETLWILDAACFTFKQAAAAHLLGKV